RIQRLEVAVEDVGRERVVERLRPVGVAAVREQAVDQLGGGDLVGGGPLAQGVVGLRGRRRRAGKQGQRSHEGEDQQGAGGLHGSTLPARQRREVNGGCRSLLPLLPQACYAA